MTDDASAWWRRGRGPTPTARWTYHTEATLVGLALARETGELLAADSAGQLHVLGRDGELVCKRPARGTVRALAWSDAGAGAVAVVDDHLDWFTRRLEPVASLQLPLRVSSLAMEAFGQYASVSLVDATCVLFDCNQRKVRQFSTTQPLTKQYFTWDEPGLVGATAFGSLLQYSFRGELQWQETVAGSVGDLAVGGGGRRLLVACYAFGVHAFSSRGTHQGSYQVDGTATCVSCPHEGGDLAIGTQERQVYRIGPEGQVLWQCAVPEAIVKLLYDPIEPAIHCGLESGEISCLDWSRPDPPS